MLKMNEGLCEPSPFPRDSIPEEGHPERSFYFHVDVKNIKYRFAHVIPAVVTSAGGTRNFLIAVVSNFFFWLFGIEGKHIAVEQSSQPLWPLRISRRTRRNLRAMVWCS
ncbi:hypothetical protein QOT17_017191 [Balamuthia mandrillaris]